MMSRVPANEGVSTVGETTERQLFADVLSAARFEVKGEKDLQRGVVDPVDQDTAPSDQAILFKLADYSDMLRSMIIERPEDVRRLGNSQILLLEHLEDHYRNSVVMNKRHDRRGKRNLMRRYLSERAIECSLSSSVDRVRNLADERWQTVRKLTDQDIARKFDEFCQEQPVSPATAAQEWLELGARTVVLAGMMPRISLQTGLREGFNEALSALGNPKQFLAE